MRKKERKKVEIVMPRPHPKQKEFLMAHEDNIIFGGARGGGKSWVVRYKARLGAQIYPGIKILIIRQSWPELTKNHIDILKRELVDTGVAKYKDKDKIFVFPNKSIIQCQYIARDADLKKIQGTEYHWIFIDEATHLTEYQIKKISAVNRGADTIPKRMYMTCNPGGPGHGYIKRLKDGKLTEEERKESYVFIQSLVTDNYALMKNDPGYIKKLEALPPKDRKMWLDGDWSVLEGVFFDTFTNDPKHYQDKRWTHVIPGFEPPRGWKLYRSFDWGSYHPFSCAWWTIDQDNVIYRILELYGMKNDEPNVGVKWTDDKIFAEIARIEREHPWLKDRRIEGVADPSIWSAEKTGLSTADTAAKHGVYFEKANNDRIAGWSQCRSRLAFDQQGYPMMYVFKNCEAFIRTVPMLVHDEHMPEDLDTDGEDHVADEWRYFCMMHPIANRVEEAEAIPVYDPLNQYKEKRRYV